MSFRTEVDAGSAAERLAVSSAAIRHLPDLTAIVGLPGERGQVATTAVIAPPDLPRLESSPFDQRPLPRLLDLVEDTCSEHESRSAPGTPDFLKEWLQSLAPEPAF